MVIYGDFLIKAVSETPLQSSVNEITEETKDVTPDVKGDLLLITADRQI